MKQCEFCVREWKFVKKIFNFNLIEIILNDLTQSVIWKKYSSLYNVGEVRYNE
jgi:hypothetical protein